MTRELESIRPPGRGEDPSSDIGKEVASNVTSGLLPERIDEEQSYLCFLVVAYYEEFRLLLKYEPKPDLSEATNKLRRMRALERAIDTVKKQVDTHRLLTRHLSHLAGNGITVVSPACGFANEMAIDPYQNWMGLEYQKILLEMAGRRNAMFNLKGNTQVWSIWEGDLKEISGEQPFPQNWKEKLGKLPACDAIYLKHFCGGGTDGCLLRAIENKVGVIVAMTCCSHRYARLSYEILAHPKELSFAAYLSLTKASSNQDTRISIPAQKIIDGLRVKYLQANGYDVQYRWVEGIGGEPLPKGGLITAVSLAQDKKHITR